MKIVVLAGGTSTERDVSLITGKMVYKALLSKGHKVVLIDTFMGYESDDISNVFDLEKDWSESIAAIGKAAPDFDALKSLRKGKGFFGPNVLNICHMADFVFMGLHGANGEDGRVQSLLDLEGIKYTGTSPIGAVLSMDKGIAKQFFRENKIPTPAGYVLKKGDEPRKDMVFPAVVKACNGGSSVGVYMVENYDECKDAIEKALFYDDEVVIEQFIKGREFSVGVIDGEALPVIEIAPKHGFYDYENKYQAGSTVETCPAEISDELTKEMQKYAEMAYECLRIESYARMDFMMSENNEIFCLEANTLPGMTPTSLLPQEAAAVGIDFPSLCEKLIEVSDKKYN